jgi:hypothetical protein
MSYLQVVCEQHRLVDEHMTRFVSQAAAKQVRIWQGRIGAYCLHHDVTYVA